MTQEQKELITDKLYWEHGSKVFNFEDTEFGKLVRLGDFYVNEVNAKYLTATLVNDTDCYLGEIDLEHLSDDTVWTIINKMKELIDYENE